MSEIKFPIEITGIDFRDGKPTDPLFHNIGDLVSVRPCGEEYKGKTYFGILLGDFPLGMRGTYNPESKKLTVGPSMMNPAIFVPDLKKIIYGCGSWWAVIESEDELRKITDEDIENTWYVKLLKSMEEKPTEET